MLTHLRNWGQTRANSQLETEVLSSTTLEELNTANKNVSLKADPILVMIVDETLAMAHCFTKAFRAALKAKGCQARPSFLIHRKSENINLYSFKLL